MTGCSEKTVRKLCFRAFPPEGTPISAFRTTICRLLAASVIISAQSGLFLPSYAADSWRDWYSKADTALNQEDLTKAEAYLREAYGLLQEQAGHSDALEKCMLKLADVLTLDFKPREAQAIYEKLLEIQAKRYGGDSKQLVPALMALGSIQESEGDHTTAMEYYNRALHINEKNYGPYSPAVAVNLHSIARATARSGRKDEAKQHYQRSISILAKDPSLASSDDMEGLVKDYGELLKGNDDSNQDLMRDFQADVLKRNGLRPSSNRKTKSTNQPTTSSNATTLYSNQSATSTNQTTPSSVQSAISSNQATPPSNQPVPSSSQTATNILQTESGMSTSTSTVVPNSMPASGNGSHFEQQQKFQLSTSRQDQTNEDPMIISRQMKQPTTDSSLSPAYNVIDDALTKRSRYGLGESGYQKMIAADIDSLGPNHPSVANDLNGLAQFYMSQERYAEAEPLLQKAVAIYKQAYGSNNLLTIHAIAALATTEMQTGHFDKASELYRTDLNTAQAALGPNSLETARILNGLAYLYLHQGRLEESCTFYKWAVASTEAAVGKDDPLLAACLKDYAQVLRSLGRNADALAAENRADQILATAK